MGELKALDYNVSKIFILYYQNSEKYTSAAELEVYDDMISNQSSHTKNKGQLSYECIFT